MLRATPTLSIQYGRSCSGRCPLCYLRKRPAPGAELAFGALRAFLLEAPVESLCLLLNPGLSEGSVETAVELLDASLAGGRQTSIHTTPEVAARLPTRAHRLVLSLDGAFRSSPGAAQRTLERFSPESTALCLTLTDRRSVELLSGGLLSRLSRMGHKTWIHMGRPARLTRTDMVRCLLELSRDDDVRSRLRFDCELLVRMGLLPGCPPRVELELDGSLRTCPYVPATSRRIATPSELRSFLAVEWARKRPCPWALLP